MTAGPVQVRAEVLNLERLGAYWALTVVAPDIAVRARPGQFVAIAVGGPSSGLLLRRCLAIAAARPGRGGAVEVAFDVHGPGTGWLSRRRRHETLDVVGPLGRPFPLPAQPVDAVLVGGGYGTASLLPLAAALRERRCRVEAVLGAASGDRLYGVLEARRLCGRVSVTTDDGSVGVAGMVTDVLAEAVTKTSAAVVYACGPMPMLRAVHDLATELGVPCQVAVEEAMACGIGVCMTCVLPVVGEDGVTRMTRSCLEGPVFDADRVRWDDIGTVPADAFGAPQPGSGNGEGTGEGTGAAAEAAAGGGRL